MGFDYAPPALPGYQGTFPEQYGYKELKILPQNYTNKPTVLNPTTHHVAGSTEKIIKSDKTKKVGKFLFREMRRFIG
jgi:hypothetical protein